MADATMLREMEIYSPIFRAKTARLTTFELGCLMILLSYRCRHGELPKTDEGCARLCNLTPRKFARHRSQVFALLTDPHLELWIRPVGEIPH